MNKGLFSLLALLWCCSAYAQNNYDEILHLSYDYFNPSAIGTSPALLSRQQTKLALGYGFSLNQQGDLLSTGFSYEWLELKPALALEETLSIHNSSLGLDYLKHWKNPSWASTISVAFGAVSDYKKKTNSAYQTSFTGMLHYGKSDDLIWTLGLLYSDQPFGSWLFPILGVDWRVTDRLYFSSILLDYAYLELTMKPQIWYAGIDIRAMGLSFVISDYENFQNSYLTSFSDSFPFYPYTLTIFNDFYLKQYISFFIKGGLFVSRENKHYTQDHQTINSIYNSTVNPSLYLKLGIAIRFRKF